MSTPLLFLQHYSTALQDQVRELQTQGKLGEYIAERYSQSNI